jgi:2-hydroxychromene-2-carboxylate isomerase
MSRTVDYFFVPQSPWTYLGHARFAAVLATNDASAAVKPIDLGRVFSLSGGLPLAKRAPQRQSYRLLELERFSRELGVPIDVHPRYFPVAGDAAIRAIAACVSVVPERAMDLAYGFMRAVWAEGRDIADPATIAAIAVENGLDANSSTALSLKRR